MTRDGPPKTMNPRTNTTLAPENPVSQVEEPSDVSVKERRTQDDCESIWSAPAGDVKIPRYARTKIPHTYVLDGQEHLLRTHGHLRCLIHTPEGQTVTLLDTCAPLSMVSVDYCEKWFPGTVPHQLDEPFRFGGVGAGGPACSQTVDLPIGLRTSCGQILEYNHTAYLVDSLSCGMILGLPFLRPNLLHIEWGARQQNDHLVTESGLQIAVSSLAPRRVEHRREANVYATRDVVIPPRSGIDLEIRHQGLPVTTEGYLMVPRMHTDPLHQTLAAPISGIVTGQARAIPFANFGGAPIAIHKGDRVGSLKAVHTTQSIDTFATDTQAAIPLADLLGECEPEEPESPRHPDGYPFHLPNVSDDPPDDLDTQADVSDHWGPEYKEQVMQIVREHAQLFRAELGKFNDGVEIPIVGRSGQQKKTFRSLQNWDDASGVPKVAGLGVRGPIGWGEVGAKGCPGQGGAVFVHGRPKGLYAPTQPNPQKSYLSRLRPSARR